MNKLRLLKIFCIFVGVLFFLPNLLGYIQPDVETKEKTLIVTNDELLNINN